MLSESRSSVLVVGDWTEWLRADERITEYERVFCFAFEAFLRLRNRLVSAPQVVDLTPHLHELEAEAWQWSSSLTRSLQLTLQSTMGDAPHFSRRSVLMWLLWPIVVARARAAVVLASAGDATDITDVGVSDIERIPLGGAARLAHLTAPADTGVGGLRVRCVRAVASLCRSSVSAMRLSIGAVRRGLSLHRIAGAARAARGENRCAAVLVSQRVHLKVLGSALSELAQRGWDLVLIDMTIDGNADLEGLDFRGHLRLNPRETGKGTVADARNSWRVRRRATEAVEQWARSTPLREYASYLSRGAWMHLRQVGSWMRVHDTVLTGLRPDVVLCANETSPVVESVIPAARALGIPSVNVQHGVITDTFRRAELEFDKFCVFGPAYGEVLERMGTQGSRIEVVGNPLLDGLRSPIGADGSPIHRTKPAKPCAEGQCFTIMFAAQHENDLLSGWLLYRTLGMVLDFLDEDSTCRAVVKLHPLGGGHELGYETALEEHAGANVSVVRDANLHDLITSADCVATYSSTVAFEAASLRVPAIIVNPLSSEDPTKLTLEGTALFAGDVTELAKCIDLIRRGVAIPDSAYERVDHRYAYRMDGRAGERIADVCESLLHGI